MHASCVAVMCNLHARKGGYTVKKGILVGTLGVGMLLLLLTTAACGTDLQPRVDELETQVAALQGEKAALEGQKQTLIDIAGPLPASLDQFFPPQAPAPVYLFEMFGLFGPFEGIIVDL